MAEAPMDYVRTERQPFLLEARVSRLYGHSSASGANFVSGEVDCIAVFEKKLEERGILTRAAMDELRARFTQEFLDATKRVRDEPTPTESDVFKHVFAERNLVGGPTVAPQSDGVVPIFGPNGASSVLSSRSDE